MTTMTLPVFFHNLDSDTTVMSFDTTGLSIDSSAPFTVNASAVFTGGVTFVSAVNVSGNFNVGSTVAFMNAVVTVLTTAQASSMFSTGNNTDTGSSKSTWLMNVVVNGSAFSIPLLRTSFI